MSALEIIGGILMLITSILCVVLVVLQESPKGGVTALTGGDSFYNKNQGRTLDAMLYKVTKVAAVLFFAFTILAYVASTRS